MLGAALDEARAEGYESAYLFSDIRPQFYIPLGFRALKSRQFSVDAAELPSTRLDLAALGAEHWVAVRRLFDLGERRREVGFLRNAAVWEWIALCARRASERSTANATNLVARRGGRIEAYVLGVRVPQRDAYVLDELGFAPGAAALVPALLRAAAGDLRRITGWLPPAPARAILPKVVVRRRGSAIPMIASLRARGRQLLETAERSGDEFCWATEHV